MTKSAVEKLFDSVSAGLRPPPVLSYSDWAEQEFRLPSTSAAAGRFRPWKFQRGILDAIGDPTIERVSVIKSARTGYTVGLVAAIGAIAANDPAPIILLMPTDDDARGVAVDEIDPAFNETKALKGLMPVGRYDGRNTLTHRVLKGGGSLKILSARAPRNLRRHTAKVLYADEVDGMEITSEGDPLKLAEKRTMSFPDRKIVVGSTPTEDGTSIIAVRYDESDKRVFEIPCMHCGEPFELMWKHLDWVRGKPDTAVCVCPSCGGVIEERYKPEMVEAGDWRIRNPDVKKHAGFRLNALISQFSNASWPNLVEEFERAEKNGPTDMQVFVNTVLGQVWSASVDHINENQLMARREPFGIAWDHEKSAWREDIPEDVAYITAGVDVQPDRLEVVLIGWSLNHRYILTHHVIRGSALLQTTWDELDSFIGTVWRHPLGGEIGISAAAVDSGYLTQTVYDYCEKVQGRKIVAIKGDEGPRPTLKASTARRRRRTATLYIVGVDQVKTDIALTLPLEKGEAKSFRLSDVLDEEFFIQLTSERRTRRLVNGKPVIKFERIGQRKAEALDCVVYGIAAKELCRFDFANRYLELKGQPVPKASLKDIVGKLHR
ncbi:phage terminase large subunit family protein [Roseibium alexandrii]|uniref:phage terminase large subunit family protein n=1 Tax=Roseibium alexandrii TaxID=388408 RepID=UPI0037529285